MRRNWIILPVAAALAVSLTACGARDMDRDLTTNNDGYTAGRTTHSRSNSRDQDLIQDGRYTAYSDGRVAPNTGWNLNRELDRMDDGLRDGMRDFWDDTKNAARDLGDGIQNAARDF